MATNTHAHDQARIQMAEITRMIEALDIDYDDLAELREATNLDEPDSAYRDGMLATADECESLDDAERRIQEHPLSLQLRSGWYTPGSTPEAKEFELLLCTGGPAVRIIGELDDYQPSRAEIEYQDWGTPWTKCLLSDDEEDVLLQYCNQFYFGD